MPQDENEFWTDEYFFKSQDPRARELEKKRHPDTGKRVPIVARRAADVVSKIAAREAAAQKQEETRIQYHPESEFSKN